MFLLGRPRLLLTSLLLAFAWASYEVRADVRLPHVIGSRMVLQRDKPLPVWGWGDPGEAVTVTFDGETAKADCDTAGKWRVTLRARPAGGPHTMTVSGMNSIELTDVLVGEVWVCSGQSNMQWALAASQRAGQDIPKANHPNLRLIGVPLVSTGTPREDVAADWAICTPDSARNFSAVAYYFGLKLHEELGVPVGLINSSWGGSPIEPWTPRVGFEAIPSLHPFVEKIDGANAENLQAVEAKLAAVESWLAKARKAVKDGAEPPEMPTIDPHPLANWGPTSIYNAMIQPLVPYAVRGAIWYQGEANNGQSMAYFEKMKGLVSGWREVWKQGDFPFLYVQLAPWSRYAEGNLEGIWEAQLAALSIPNTGMAVTTDLVSNINDIHPVNKHDVGDRLARWALAKTYGRSDLVYSGPLYKSATREGDKIRVHFNHAAGLKTRDGKAPDYFQVGNAEGFADAQALIDGETVVAWSDKVKAPEFVRFGWKNTANPNLVNGAGLPASPFRTDCGVFTFSTGNRFAREKRVEISAGPYQGTIRFTLDGSIPSEQSPAYKGPLELTRTATVTARLFADDGRSSLPARATYTKVAPISFDGKQLAPGINCQVYAGEWTKLPEIDSLKPVRTAEVDMLVLTPAAGMNNFAIRYTGFLDIPKAGDYVFHLTSDDGSRLHVDGQPVVENDGIHPAIEKTSGKVALSAGLHPFTLDFFERGGNSHLSLQYDGPGISKQPVPEAAYFRTE